jgi:hypothetical protein
MTADEPRYAQHAALHDSQSANGFGYNDLAFREAG